jgi:hypothetical protein
VNPPFPDHRQRDQNQTPPSILPDASGGHEPSGTNPLRTSSAVLIPAFDRGSELKAGSLHVRFEEACTAWLTRSPSQETRAAYTRELKQFLDFVGIAADHLEQLTTVRPNQVAAWRDHLRERGLSNVAIVRLSSRTSRPTGIPAMGTTILGSGYALAFHAWGTIPGLVALVAIVAGALGAILGLLDGASRGAVGKRVTLADALPRALTRGRISRGSSRAREHAD